MIVSKFSILQNTVRKNMSQYSDIGYAGRTLQGLRHRALRIRHRVRQGCPGCATVGARPGLRESHANSNIISIIKYTFLCTLFEKSVFKQDY